MEKTVLTIDEIRSALAEICKDSSVNRIWLFGSYARNEADSESDIDLIVDLDRALDIEIFDSIDGVKLDTMSLSLFNRKRQSDLLFNKRFVERVDKDKILVYEAENLHRTKERKFLL